MNKFQKECFQNRQAALNLSLSDIQDAFYTLISSNFIGTSETSIKQAISDAINTIKNAAENVCFLPEYASQVIYSKVTDPIYENTNDKIVKLKCLTISNNVGSNDGINLYDGLTKKITIQLAKTLGKIEPSGQDVAFNALKIIRLGFPLDPEFRLTKKEVNICKENGRSYHHSIAGAITGYVIEVLTAQAEAKLDSQLMALVKENRHQEVFSLNASFIENSKSLLFC